MTQIHQRLKKKKKVKVSYGLREERRTITTTCHSMKKCCMAQVQLC